MEKKIIIVGGGIAGLSAGCFGQMNGYKTEIFEMHGIAGGLCTGWNRKGYSINAGFHWMAGVNPVICINQIWKELGALKGLTFLDTDEIVAVEIEGEDPFILYSDMNKMKEYMLRIAPDDTKLIQELFLDMKEFTTRDIPVLKIPQMYTAKEGLQVMKEFRPLLKIMKKWKKVSLGDYAKKFSSKIIRDGLPGYWIPEYAMVAFLTMVAWSHIKAGSSPLCSPLKVINNIVNRYSELGGTLRVKSKVSRILVENRKAVGIELEDGTKHYSDYVISAADGYSTIFKMLDGKYVSPYIKKSYKKLHTFPGTLLLSFGVAAEIRETTPRMFGQFILLPEPIMLGNEKIERVVVKMSCDNPELSPAGKTLVTCSCHCDYSYWENLAKDKQAYKNEKNRVANIILDALEQRYNGIKDSVEMVDVATPVTYHRYTDVYKGSDQGWMITPDTYKIKLKKTLPGLKNFRMVGHWLEMGGGVPPAMITGREAIQYLCYADKKAFTSSIASAD